MSLTGGRLESEKHTHEVYEIIRTLGNGERLPVRFREITKRLSPPPGSNDTTWRRVTAQRAINRLRAEGWIEKTIEGYQALDPPLYPFYALRANLEELLNRGIRLLDIPPDGTGAGDREWLVAADWLSLELATTLGLWIRAIDRRILERAKSHGYFFGRYNNAGIETTEGLSESHTVGYRAGALASELVHGYLAPEEETAMGLSGLHEKQTTSVRAYREEVERLVASGRLASPGQLLVSAKEHRESLRRARRAARVLRPLRSEAIRTVRRVWQNESRTGYSREFE